MFGRGGGILPFDPTMSETDPTTTEAVDIPKPHRKHKNRGRMGVSPEIGGKHLSESLLLKMEIESAMYEQRQNWSEETVGSRRSTSSRSHYRKPSGAGFVQTNYRFASRQVPVDAGPDDPLDWSLVDQVLVPCSAPAVSCPICLDTPQIPRVARCGHVFCCLCLLRFGALGARLPGGSFGAAWRRCPVCFEPFSLKEIKPARLVPLTETDMAQVRFVLRGYPSRQDQSCDRFDQLDPFVRVSQVTDAYVRDEIAGVERAGIQSLLSSASIDPFDADLLQAELERPAPSGIPATPLPPKGKPAMFFHQAADGQPLFLQPLSIKMLKDQYGAYDSFPAVLPARVLEVEWLVMDGELRRRYKHVAHLPIGTTFGLCEVDLGRVVAPGILHKYRRELEGRQRLRDTRARQDEERRQTASRQEHERMHAEIYGNWMVEAHSAGQPLSVTFSEPIGIPPAHPIKSGAGSFASITAGDEIPAAVLSASVRRKKGTVLFNNGPHRSYR